jgi:DNA-binding MarR family transcriptional regulator
MAAAASAAVRKPKRKTRARAQLESRAWELLGELFVLQRPRMMALCREFDLYPPQLLVLKALDRPRPMREVAATMACDSSNLTGITDRLEERGIVRRTSDAKDRRVKLLVLTDEGERLRAEVNSRLNKPPAAIDALSDRDLRDLQALLRKALPEA